MTTEADAQRRQLDSQQAPSAPQAESQSADAELEPVDRLAGTEPAQTLPGVLGSADRATRERAIGQWQRQHGNAFVQRVVQLHIRHRRDPLVQREGESAVPMDTGVTPSQVQETVGPVSESTYKVSASSLADAASEIEARDEAALVEYAPKLDFKQVDDKVTEVTIDVQITMEMPQWSPPKDMGPKAKAEWTRALGALRAHEDGHVQLVHKYFDGLGKKLLGKSSTKAKELFNAAKASLDKATKDYDKTTDHGRKTGTVINVSIEETEKKELEAAKAKASEKK